MKVLVAQACLTLCNPMHCSPPGSSVHGIFQARILEWVAISFSRESSHHRNRTQVSCIAGSFFTLWSTRCFAHSPNLPSGKKTLRDNVTCNRGTYYWFEPGSPALTKGVRTKRPKAPVLSGIYWVQLLVGAIGLVTQLQGNFCWPNPSWAFSFPLIGSLFLARHMLIGWLQVAW